MTQFHTEGHWRAALNEDPPARVAAGRGTVLFIAGWLFNRRSPLRRLTLRLGENAHEVANFGIPRLDVYRRMYEPGDTPGTAAYTSGFWHLVPVPAAPEPRLEDLWLEAEAVDGSTFRSRLAVPTFISGVMLPDVADADPRRIAICMATYDPPLDLFRRQIASIREQTHENWHCVITDDGSPQPVFDAMRSELHDDPRFTLHRNETRLGFYFNFGHALERVPRDAGLIALADQDDVWHPNKLERLLGAMRDGVTLAYSDQRIVGDDGRVISPTFWTDRQNQWQDLSVLLTNNTVTGASTLFRRELLDYVLPLPTRLDGAYHDHWIALVARALGEIAYVDEALYDYIQHDENVVGHHWAMLPEDGAAAVRHSTARQIGHRWQYWYFQHVLPQEGMALVLLERCGQHLGERDRRMLERVAAGEASRAGLLERVRRLPTDRHSVTLGYERKALAAIAWRRWAKLRARGTGTPFADERHAWLHTDGHYADYGPHSADA